MTDTATLRALAPVILLLVLGIASTLVSHALRLSPIVGYIALGLALKFAGLDHLFDEATIQILAELGVILLLFDIGLGFSLKDIGRQAKDVFAFGPAQMVFAFLALAGGAKALGLHVGPAVLVAAILSSSSTAVVGRLIFERRQRGCPVGLTATSILVFQDVVEILLLIVCLSLGTGDSILVAASAALVKSALAVIVTIIVARIGLTRLLGVMAHGKSEELFTALALTFALAAGWLTGTMGLSLTLGAFLGGLALAETPYKAVIEYEIKPFRGLLMGFFFISIGLSFDVEVITRSWPLILSLTFGLFALKASANIFASLVFRWSIPGSIQLGFLLSQGSEFSFVILSLPAVRAIIGPSNASILIAIVATSMALTPNFAEAGRRLAGHMRARTTGQKAHELIPQSVTAPVIIVGMGSVGRLVADALIAFHVDYYAVERDQARLRSAIADGYIAGFGDGTDARLWPSVSLQERKLSVLTAPDTELLEPTKGIIQANYPNLIRFGHASNEDAAKRLRAIGIVAVIGKTEIPGMALAEAVLNELKFPENDIRGWLTERSKLSDDAEALKVAA